MIVVQDFNWLKSFPVFRSPGKEQNWLWAYE